MLAQLEDIRRLLGYNIQKERSPRCTLAKIGPEPMSVPIFKKMIVGEFLQWQTGLVGLERACSLLHELAWWGTLRLGPWLAVMTPEGENVLVGEFVV